MYKKLRVEVKKDSKNANYQNSTKRNNIFYLYYIV